MEYNRENKVYAEYFEGFRRVSRNDVMKLFDDDYEVILLLSETEIAFINNPIMYMHQQGRDIVENFNLLGLFPFLVKEYTAMQYLNEKEDISEKLLVIHNFLSESIVNVFWSNMHKVYVLEIEPIFRLFEDSSDIIMKTCVNLMMIRRRNGDY